MPKEKIFSKLKYKDYNNMLEQVLEKKDFSSTGKNLILSVLYKMETNYNDYKTVKRDITDKEKILVNFINIVKNYCNSLIIIKPESKKSVVLNNTTSKYIANSDNKELEVFPNEKYILEGIYSLYDNENMVNDKYGILKDAITEILKNGNSSNNIELLRDFNGFAWYIEPNEFEDIYSNLIFQDIRIIAGNDLLKDWIYNKNEEIDYILELKKELNRRYDQEMAEQLFNQIMITILKVYIERHPAKIKELEVQEKEDPQDMKKYVEEISRDKKKLLRQVENLDRCINDTDKLTEELVARNKVGESIKNESELKEILIEERQKCINKIIEYNITIDPRQFMKKMKKQTNKTQLFDYKVIAESDTTALDELINLQKLFLKGYKILAEKLKGKKEVLELLYEFRYYNLIPITRSQLLKDNEELNEDIDNMREFLITKAIDEKLINSVNSNKYINNEILKNIFSLRIINLENAEVNIQHIQEGIRVNYLDGDVEETSKNIAVPENIGKYKVKEKKKIKIFS